MPNKWIHSESLSAASVDQFHNRPRVLVITFKHNYSGPPITESRDSRVSLETVESLETVPITMKKSQVIKHGVQDIDHYLPTLGSVLCS